MLDAVLTDPVAQRGVIDPQLLSDLSDRSARGTDQVHRVTLELLSELAPVPLLPIFHPDILLSREVSCLRGEVQIAVGGATSADDWHLVLAAATGLFVAAYVAATAVGFGWVLRLYSVATIAAALVLGLLSAQVDKLEAGASTLYMGVLERLGMGVWLVWRPSWRWSCGEQPSPKVTVSATAEPVDRGRRDAH
jgi:hypothetical protein